MPVAALLGLDAVTNVRGNAGEGGEQVRGGLGGKGLRQVVDQAACDDQLAVVFKGELDFGFGVEGGGVGPGACCCEVARSRQAKAVKKRKQKHERVPGEH